MLYRKFSEYLYETYGEKVYKIPVHLPVTCPNRDGRISQDGCVFCGDEGAGFESLPSTLSVLAQLQKNIAYISQKYHANRFIAYYQNYSNTYLPLDDFRKALREGLAENVVALYISTRPDCLNDQYLEAMAEIGRLGKVDILVELGLQSVNVHTLNMLHRGHGLAEFIDSVIRAQKYGLKTCTHMITDLPMETIEDVKEGARILSALGTNQVKCHSLYVLKDTRLGDWYHEGRFKPLDMDEYMERTITFLEYLSPNIVVQRLIGRAPEERSLFCSWSTSWWKVVEMLEDKMKRENRYQGKSFNYLNGERCRV